MSQLSTRDRLAARLAEMGGVSEQAGQADKTLLRERLRARLAEQGREGSLSKLPPAFAQGTVEAAAKLVGQSGLIGQGLEDAAVGAGSVLALNAMRRGGGLQTGSRPISTGRVASLGGGPADPAVQAQVDAEAADVPRLWSNEAPVAQAAAEVSDAMNRWGQQRFAFTPSSGLVAGTLENAAMSAPTTVAGAGIGVGVGAVTGNPAAGLAAGSAFMALTDAAGVMEETYEKGKAAGLSERDAVVKANQVGAVYAGASALLERVGLGSILRGSGPVAGTVKRRMLDAALRAGEAAATEGVTEVAQGVAQRGLQAYALDDWQGFTEAYTQSDEPLKEFMAGALLGGGIRGVGEAANPANYKSAKDYQKAATAQTQLDGSVLGVGERPLVAGVSLDGADAGVGNVPQAQGVAAPEGGRAQQGQAQNQNERAAVPSLVDPSQQGQRAEQQGTESGGGQQVVPRQQGVQNSAAGPQDQSENNQASEGDLIPIQSAPPISEPTLRRFTTANRVQSVRQVEPETPAQRRAVSFFAERNVPVYLVASPDGSPLRVPAMWSGDGVVIDANAGTPEYTRALVYHEAFHDLKRRNPTAWIRAYQAVRELDPEGLARSEAEYFGRAEAQGVAVDRDALSEDEALSTYAEAVSGWLEAARRDPAKMRRLAEQNPRTLARVLDAIQRAMRAVGFNVTPILERQGAERTAARIATELTAALDTLIGQPTPQTAQPEVSSPSPRADTQPQNPGSEVVEVASVSEPVAAEPETVPAQPDRQARENGDDPGQTTMFSLRESDDYADLEFRHQDIARALKRKLAEAGWKVDKEYVALSGSWYMQVEHSTEGWLEKIRISDHENTSSSHAAPDINILSGKVLTDADYAEIIAALNEGNTGVFEGSGPPFDQSPGQTTLFSLRDPDSLNAAAVAHFGTTEDPREAGYILTDGRMLDLSGRHNGRRFRPGERAVSHTDLPESIGGGVDGLLAFMRDAGAVRMNMFDGSVHLAGPATEAQVDRISREFADAPSFFVEIDADGTGQQRAYRRVDVPNRRSVARALRDAGRVLSGEIVPEDARFAIREPDPKAVSLLDALPDPPKPSRAQRKFFRRNSTEGMFNGIDPDPQTGFEAMLFSFRRTMQDKFHPILRVQQAVVRAGGFVSDAMNAYRTETLYYGRAAEQSRQLNKRLVEPLFRKMTDAGIERGELDLYLYAKHAPERNRVIREKNPEFEGDGSGMSDADAAAIVARFEAGNKGAAFKDLAVDVGRIRDWTLAYMVKNDLLSEAQAQAWRDTYQNYVPLRTADTGRTPLSPGQGFQVRGKESKEALGRRSLADSPLLFLIHQADHTIVRAERNRVGLAFMRLIVGNPDKNLWNVYRRNVTRRTEPDMWGNTETEIVRNPAMPDLDQRNTIVVKEKGEERYLVVNNPDLVRAMKNMGTAHVPWALRQLGALMRLRSSLVTTYSPEFMLTNFTRDIQTAAFNIGAEIDTATVSRVLGNVRKAMAGAWEATRAERRDSDAVEGEWAKTFREFVEDGGKTGWAGAYSFEDRAKDIARTIKNAKAEQAGILKALIGVKNLIEDANVAVENAVRVALYAELRRQGVSRAKAAETGKNLTVNFNRKGEAGTLLNTLYLFYNAGIQGSVRTLQAANTRRGRKIVLGIATSGLLMNFLNAFLSDEDEDGELFYDKISPWIKSHNLILMLPGTGGRYLKVPLPYGYNVFHAFGTHTASAMRGEAEPGEAMGHVGASFLNSFNPIGGGLSLVDATPELAKPFMEIRVNENFMGAPISPQRFPGETRPNSEVFFPRTSLPAREIASFFNRLSGGNEVEAGSIDLRPGSIDHMFDFITGAAGRFIKETFVDLPARVATGEGLEVSSTPFARRFLGQPAEQRHESRFWRNKGEADALLSFERRYLKSDEPGRVEAFRARKGVKLDAAREFRIYAKIIEDLMEKQADGEGRVTDEQIEALRIEANRAMRAAERGEAWETPILDGTSGVGRIRREERNRLRELEREAARR